MTSSSLGTQETTPSDSPPFVSGDEPIADAAVRVLLEQYAIVAGATLREVGPNRLELLIPAGDRAIFAGRQSVRLAFSVDALHENPDAEMAVPGSAFLEQLIAAIRRRGARRAFGTLPPTIAAAAEEAALPIPVANGSAGVPDTELVRHPVGRLTARVTLRAGTSLHEHLVDSGLFDLSTGVALPPDVASACEAATAAGRLVPATASERLTTRPVTELVRLMLQDLERRLAPEVERTRAEADRALSHELNRIDRYYTTLLSDTGGRGTEIPSADARRAVESEHQRRRQEEITRHAVRADVHPVQLAEWSVAMQQAEWELTSHEGRSATITAQRALIGDGVWTLACPTCGSAPEALVVCLEAHASCSTCSATCSVCASGFCRDHGLLSCHVDGAPACAEHARTCSSCRKEHCTAHDGRCGEGDHPACTTCLAACAHCGKVVCDAHATATNPDSLLGPRRLCPDCVRCCEGGTGEIVGPDEVTRCASCDRVVCTRHQTTCAIDGHVHCSRHMRRTDRSRRLVCEHDRATCSHEPNAVLASDEVVSCASCGDVVCTIHSGECVEDGQRHCTTHLVTLRDRGGFGCKRHYSTCHVDGVTFSLAGTVECPVCGKPACRQHTGSCPSCGRDVCTADINRAATQPCRTCQQFTDSESLDGLLIQAVSHALGDGVRPRSWRIARDATHRIIELDLGWTRRVVVSVRHGSERPEVVMRHSLLGSKRG